MTDEMLAVALAERVAADQPHKMMAAPTGPHAGRLRDAIRWLVSQFSTSGVAFPWEKFRAFLPLILQMVMSGTMDWPALLKAIWELFYPTPVPAPVIAAGTP